MMENKLSYALNHGKETQADIQHNHKDIIIVIHACVIIIIKSSLDGDTKDGAVGVYGSWYIETSPVLDKEHNSMTIHALQDMHKVLVTKSVPFLRYVTYIQGTSGP